MNTRICPMCLSRKTNGRICRYCTDWLKHRYKIPKNKSWKSHEDAEMLVRAYEEEIEMKIDDFASEEEIEEE